ncbi:MAG: type II toxin-antitoxin system RelE/ParE family toxin [Lachnospiraceae bacterium]|jgi:phage-related protein|nr:type II toxin-antitoxin system RelE/ParE family toxin [Lachnospiraceae bacterium]
MYTVEFYETADGKSELWDFLENLRKKAATSKDARIQHKQISLYIQLLQDNGTHLNETITKHLDDGIWELRPGSNRVFYFFYHNNTFVLLHHFRKKSQKTPKREIEKAKAERNDYLSRKEI